MHAWLEVDLGAIVGNARELACRAAPAALCAVVKANAYGHGAVPVGKALEAAAIPGLRFGVFAVCEGLALRDAGVATPILVLGPASAPEAEAAAAADLECAVLDAADASAFPRGLRVHVKVDTGVARFGVPAANASAAIDACRASGLRVVGLYSHLANSEDLDERFTRTQLERLESVPHEGLMTHIAASAAAIMWPFARLDMVRCGIALYGRWPSEAVRTSAASSGLALAPALRWFAPIVSVRDVAAGDPVGYGCEFVAARASKIAVLPLGYADGLPRAAGGGALHVVVRDSRAPIVGRICMNACMVDVTGVTPAVTRGDIVRIDIDEAARAARTIDYEILARLPSTLERRYR